MTTAVLEGIAGSLSVASRIAAGGRRGAGSRAAGPPRYSNGSRIQDFSAGDEASTPIAPSRTA